MVLRCKFSYEELTPGKAAYICNIENSQTPENRELEIFRKHLHQRDDDDVDCVKFYNCKIASVPQGLTSFFPNLKSLCIMNSKLKKISKSDLVEYKNMENIFISK